MPSYGFDKDENWIERDSRGNTIRVIEYAEKSNDADIIPYKDSSANIVHATGFNPKRSEIKKTSEVDRAFGFAIKISLLSLPFMIISGAIAYKFYETPIFSSIMMIVLFGTYGFLWLVSYILNELLSQEAISIINNLMVWKYMSKEQKLRHEYYMKQLEKKNEND